MTFYTTYETPIGTLTLQAGNAGLTGAWFANQVTHPMNAGKRDASHPVLRNAVDELDEYFDGRRKVFSVAIAPEGTPFQQTVWAALGKIPHGQTKNYQELATAIGNQNAMRAVGTANGKNPISIIIPCHRVINKSGALGGYVGGIERKAWLLQHEAKAPH